MAPLITIVAVIVAATWIRSGLTKTLQITPTDRSSRGRWGVCTWTSPRTRVLDAHERRWETAILAAERQENRWPELLDELRRLERAAEIASAPSPPAELDLDWFAHQVERLEHAIPDDTTT